MICLQIGRKVAVDFGMPAPRTILIGTIFFLWFSVLEIIHLLMAAGIRARMCWIRMSLSMQLFKHES